MQQKYKIYVYYNEENLVISFFELVNFQNPLKFDALKGFVLLYKKENV